MKTHDAPKQIPVTAQPTEVLIVDLLEDSASDDGRKIPTLEEVTEPMKEKEAQTTFNCTECPFGFTGMLDLKSHIEISHTKKVEVEGIINEVVNEKILLMKKKEVVD